MRLDEFIASQAEKIWKRDDFKGTTEDVMLLILQDNDFMKYVKGIVVLAKKKTDEEKAELIKTLKAGRLLH